MAKKISRQQFDSAVEQHLNGVALSSLLLQIPMEDDGDGHIHPIAITDIRKLVHVAMRMVTRPEIVNAKVSEFAGRPVRMAPEIVKPKLERFAEFLDAYCEEPYQPDGTFGE